VTYLDGKIAELEQEYQVLSASWPTDVARSCEIVSELGRLWNAKLRYEPGTDDLEDEMAGDSPVNDVPQIQTEISEIVREGRAKMASARSQGELRAVFEESMLKIIGTLDEE
jgi:hypothetical protein